MKFNPELLLACAAYVASDVYDPEIALDLLRRDALLAVRMTSLREHGRGSPLITATDSEADALTQAHLDALAAYAKTELGTGEDPWAWSRMNARAILRATPGMVVWWCEVLGKDT